ncbi:[LysW]-aminoadipate semialdehyde/glutamate semialdehyde transaminase [Metallosphaera sp. J1]|uniref:[LysW]-aminoadipate semialdehyde/glutamate semialdehyde transaminase n=1 Tax=Metallosphaera TaxID=41980 RepID=UPI001EDCA651|nr:[LysW]-aminoadipate semialdehyde/glutamate semialdehyde transaminase [Metallosphaera javensis (ex Hofmann et al. 2022)]MCG3109888.1 [LysW]-aminoadipate semialdehyde/glutamate semialdehyde transaminase [Metallosphaera javensis (ex Hofmann et al. 2022)]BCS92144.1 MAG: aspartate aminotransferase family protein [Metallosphaera javensis (ex Sakai et al. 2022)]
MKLITFYGSRGLRIVKGENQYVWDDKGKRYLDLHAGHGVAFLGHRNPKVVEYLKRQLDTIVTLTTAFDVDIRDEMLREMDDLKPEGMDNIFLLNSGTEAVELSMKIARKITGRKKFVAFKNSFHGRTMGSLSITWNKKYREPFEPLISPIEFLEFNQIEELKKLDDSVAAVILEPVQGEGGVVPAKPEFVKALREETERRGILLVSDEVQAGFGRTGRVWAYQHYGIRPDILTAGKAIGGGFPVSAVFVPDSIAEKLGEGDHGTTYGGNPMAAAAVTAASKVLKEDRVPEQAKVKGETFMKMLREALVDFRSVREVRGLGLMIGVDLRLNPGTAIKVLQDNGVLSLKAGVSTIRFLSPYMINNQDMELAVDATRKGVAETEGKKTS